MWRLARQRERVAAVDNVQQLLEQAVYKPVQGRFKVFMIDEAHQLTKDAFSALLKTLEQQKGTIPSTKLNKKIGDINAIMNAHNLAMVALTSRLQHERNYTDEQLERLSGMKRLDIDPTNVEISR